MRNAYLFALMLVLAGCVSNHPANGWHRVSGPNFSYALPADLQMISENSADSHIVQYQDDDMIVTFDEGVSGGGRLDSLAKYPNYASQTQVIHSVGVQLVTFDIPPGPGHRFNYAAAASYRGAGLTVYIHCKTQSQYQVATQIFKTVRSKYL
jgi:hypothetical protein